MATEGDAYARCRTGSTAGRGSVAGWTACPLCTSLQGKITINNLLQHDTNTNTNNQNFHNNTFSNQFIKNLMSNNLPNKSTTKSVKLFSHGRGLAAHLHAVHTPWNPGKAELKRRKALQKRIENERRRLRGIRNNDKHDDDGKCNGDDDGKCNQERSSKRQKVSHKNNGPIQENAMKEKWDPSEEETNQWNQRVMEIVALVESEAKTKNGGHYDADNVHVDETNDANNTVLGKTKTTMVQSSLDNEATKGRDRSGKVCLSYRESLPPFLSAAADGNLTMLKQCICIDVGDDKIETYTRDATDDAIQSTSRPRSNCDPNGKNRIKSLLSLRDRNGSTAEHWAAGGGHVKCVAYLLELRDLVYSEEPNNDVDARGSIERDDHAISNKKVRRRRDGKTSLHYASRNGHNAIIDLILSRPDAPSVDIASGDGTTPLHLACYGGHPSTVKHLIETHNANVSALNEWECGSAHWVAMSLGSEGSDKVIELCEYLKKSGVDFTARQKQGHAPLHKAASRKNRRVIEWLANSSNFTEEERARMCLPDVGGNLPSDIWINVGGDKEFALWMKDTCGW